MNENKETAIEFILMNSYKKDMIHYLDSHPEEFTEAIELAIGYKQPYSKRAAWLLWSCMQNNDSRIRIYREAILNGMYQKQDDHQRELIKVLLKMDLDRESEGKLFNLCISVWKKTNKKSSVRLTAFKMLVKILKNHRQLSSEVQYLIQDEYLDSLSSVARKSILKMVRGIF